MVQSTVGPRGALLVGSVPLQDSEAVFSTAGRVLGRHLRRLPDGETGARLTWAYWQLPALAANPAFESRAAAVLGPAFRAYARWPRFKRLVNRLSAALQHRGVQSIIRVRPGVRMEDVSFGPLGFAAYARHSYAVVRQLQQEGILPPHLRFQVSLPTPLVTIQAFPLEQQEGLLPKYEARLREEVKELATSVPPAELAIQWDTAVEFSILEGVWHTFLGSPSQAHGPITDMLRRIGDCVPEPIELGYHLCYGDAGHKHFVEPQDAGLLVEVANTVLDGLRRPVSWLHLPVPRARDDEAYAAPLAALRVSPATELYLGLIHLTDGAEGARRRIAAAQRCVQHEFGVATECGLGRRDPAAIPAIVALHAQVAEPIL